MSTCHLLDIDSRSTRVYRYFDEDIYSITKTGAFVANTRVILKRIEKNGFSDKSRV